MPGALVKEAVSQSKPWHPGPGGFSPPALSNVSIAELGPSPVWQKLCLLLLQPQAYSLYLSTAWTMGAQFPQLSCALVLLC